MADHVRKQLRSAVITTLTGLTTTGSDVFDEDHEPDLQADQLPALLVSVESEQVENVAIGFPRRQTRSMVLIVEAVVRQSSGVAALLDTIGKEVETALNASSSANTASNVARGGIDLDNTEKAYGKLGELDVGRLRMFFTATVYTASNAPDVAL